MHSLKYRKEKTMSLVTKIKHYDKLTTDVLYRCIQLRIDGFIVKNKDISFYYAGDTALHMDMKLIGEYDKLDFAVLPIGNNFTMGIDDAIIASDFIKCDKIVGIHYDTFGYIEIDHEDAKRKFTERGKELILLEIGQTIQI